MPDEPKIVVVGSINMDLVIRCETIPVPGQTIIANWSTEIPGGKGANQAVGSSRAGGNVSLVGRVGSDSMANRLIENLDGSGVGTAFVKRTDNCASGIAIVAVEGSGENAIMVVPGSNGRVSDDDVNRAAEMIRGADMILLQLEIPISTVLYVIDLARAAGVRVVLDPAPMPAELPPEALEVDVLCPNQSEAEQLVGYAVETVDDAHRAAEQIVNNGTRHAVITLADKGAVIHDGTSSEWIQPFAVKAVDTTAAGDAFAGALTVRLAEGAALSDAALFACAAGAIVSTRLGAQPAMPDRSEIEALITESGR